MRTPTPLRSILVAALATAIACLAPATNATAATATNNPDFTANAMAPLWVSPADMATFESQIQTAKEYGVDAISVLI